jgi:peptide/nickel transport system ATP-binding protein
MSSLNPVLRIGDQIAEAVMLHQGLGRGAALAEARRLLEHVRVAEAERQLQRYPFQLSGGMRQRVMIAMALVNDPELLIADEPTTALDVTVQAQILDLILELQQEFGSAIVIITHDLGVVAELSDDILVMYGGRVAEYGSAWDIFSQPKHPYTWGLMASMPRLDRDRASRLVPIPGTPPSLIRVPSGCPFHPRCPYTGLTGGRCSTEVPLLSAEMTPGHTAACHLTVADKARLWAEQSAGHILPGTEEPVSQGGVES